MAVWLEYHSDGAVNSYTTGTSMKDTYRPDDVDMRGIACCRPESRHHPAALDTCLGCHRATGRRHAPCPHPLYHPPHRPVVETPYGGPRPGVRVCSAYTVKAKFHYTDPRGPARTLSETRTDPTEFLGDPGRKKVRAGPVGPV